MKLNIQFDEEKHEYYEQLPSGRRVIPSVTQILSAMGQMDYSFVKPWYADRGSKIHKAIHLWIAGRLNESRLDERIKPYLAAYKSWAADLKIIPKESEGLLYHPSPEFAGTHDLVCDIYVNEYLVDYKSGKKEAWHILQLCLYAFAKWGREWMKRRIGNLYLSGKGLYKWQPYELADQMRAGAKALKLLMDYDRQSEEMAI